MLRRFLRLRPLFQHVVSDFLQLPHLLGRSLVRRDGRELDRLLLRRNAEGGKREKISGMRVLGGKSNLAVGGRAITTRRSRRCHVVLAYTVDDADRKLQERLLALTAWTEEHLEEPLANLISNENPETANG